MFSCLHVDTIERPRGLDDKFVVILVILINCIVYILERKRKKINNAHLMHAFCASGKESVHACSYYSRCSELGVYSIKIKVAKAVRALVIRHYIFSCTSKLGSHPRKVNLNKVGLTAPRLGIVLLLIGKWYS